MLALPPSVLADPPEVVCPFDDWPNRCVVPGVTKGEPAPLTGDLFTPDYAIWLNHEVEGCPARIDAAVTATTASGREDLKAQRIFDAADKRVVEVERDAYKRELAAQPNVYLWTGLAAGVTAIIVTVIYVGTGGGQRLRDLAAGDR